METLSNKNLKLNLSLTQDLFDYLAPLVFVVLILSILRRKTAVTNSQAVNVGVTRDVGCGTEFDDEHDDEKMTRRSKKFVLTEFKDDDKEQRTRDFYQNTDSISLNDVATNTDPIIMTPNSRSFYHNHTGSPSNQGNNVESNSPTTVFDFHLDLDRLIPTQSKSTVQVPQADIAPDFKSRGSSSKSTQTYNSDNEVNHSTSRIRGRVNTCKTRSRIPVLLKKNQRISITGVQNEQEQISPHVSTSMSSDLKNTTMYPDFNINRTIISPSIFSNQRHNSSSSSSSSNWSRSPSYHSMDQKTILRDKLWSDRYRYCDSNIKNGVLLRSPSKQQNIFQARPRRSFTAVGIHDSTAIRIDSSRLKNGERAVRKCRSFGGEKIDFVPDSSPQNFVVNPRRRYQSKSKCNRRLYKISYISGS